MATDQEMRAWAKESGIDVPARGKLPEDVRTAYADAHRQILPEDVPDGGVAETRPRVDGIKPKPETVMEKLKAKVVPHGEDARVTTRHKRVPLDGMGTALWGMLAKFTQPARLPATGNMLRFQAPFAGVLIEKSLAGTALDRMVQPVARLHEQLAPIGSLLAAPMLVATIEPNPALLPQIAPLLEDAVVSMYAVAGPALRKAQQEREKVREELGVTGVTKMMAEIFGISEEEYVAVTKVQMPGEEVPVAA